ncbi:MAG TPA: hypothetical protein VGI39_31010 [Polyangiaceae bacterium]|jgi:hypothetical protein
MRWLPFAIALALAAACASSAQVGFSPTDGGGEGTSGEGGSPPLLGADGGGTVVASCDGGAPVSGATITAAGGPHLVVHGQPATVQLTASAGGSQITGTWTTSDTAIGSVGSDGLFHANGYVGGTVDVTLIPCRGQLSITLTVDVDITDNPGNLGGGDQTVLQGGGPASPSFAFLYPFDGTVFPRGLQAPLLQFGDGKTVTSTANATYLKLTTTHFSYQQFGAGGTPIQLVIPDPVWKGAALSAATTDPVSAAVTARMGNTVTGPLTENWRIAPGSLKGFIYYSTYKSPLLPNDPSTNVGGGILRVRPGSAAEVVQKGCVVCHSLSADGSVLAAASGPDLSNPTSSDAVNLTPATPAPTPRSPSGPGQQFAFAALTPDGALALTNGNPGLGPPDLPHGFSGAYQSILVNTSTGAAVNSPSLTQLVHAAQTPAFSPDGKHVAFINGDAAPTTRPLSLMDFDGTSVFSNLRVLRNETETTTNAYNASVGWTPSPPPPATPTNFPPPGTSRPKTIAWPSFTPDSTALIYGLGDSYDSSGFNLNGGNLESPPQYAELRLIELDGTVRPLNALNGRDASGTSTLPYGEAVDNQMNYEPNMMPLPVGGYYWVVFTSRRAYGNTIAPGRAATTQPYDEPAQDPWGSNAGPSPRKKLWIAAIDLNHADPTNADPSHPAFYLSGQELASANMRGFAALAPCVANGSTCETGADCCGGYCRQTGTDPNGEPILQCVAPPVGSTCSNVDEPCMTPADCCDPKDLCIAGRCATPPPPK